MKDFLRFFLLFCLLLGPEILAAKSNNNNTTSEKPEAQNIWLTYGFTNFIIGAPSDSASNEIKAYAEIIPNDLTYSDEGATWTLAYIFDNADNKTNNQYSLSLIWGRSEQVEIEKEADVNGTPNDTTDDPLVHSAQFSYSMVSFFYLPKRPFFLGAGLLQASLNIDQTAPGLPRGIKRIRIDENVVYAGLTIGLLGIDENNMFVGNPVTIARSGLSSVILNLAVFHPVSRHSMIERIFSISIGAGF